MGAINKQDIDIIGIAKALSDKRLKVPAYQRSYSWEDKQINDLFLDISNAINSNKEDYFLGSIVVTVSRDNKREVVDGQQRLATITILLSAIRDFFLKEGDVKRAKNIENTYLFEEDLSTTEILSKLQLNNQDNDFLRSKILTPPHERNNVKSNKDSHRRIEKTKEIADEFVSNITKTDSNWKDRLVTWVEFLKDHAKVIWIEVEDYSNAFTIFETLNDRGLDLTVSDLLKNHLYSLAGDRQVEVQEKWIQMTSTIEAVESESYVVKFVHHAWASKNGLTRERELFSKIKSQINDKQKAVSYADELLQLSGIYAALLNSENEYWDEYGNAVKDNIKTLAMLKMQQNRPLLLSLLKVFNKIDVIASIDLLVAWAVRFIISGRLGSSELEKNFSNNASRIANNNIINKDQLFQAMKSILPTNDEFENDFANATINRPELARYILSKIEINFAKQNDSIPNSNPDFVNLEHVLPRRLNNQWTHIPEESHQHYHRRIGNLCLLNSKLNQKIGNAPFDEKKKHFEKSPFLTTSSICRYATWDSDAIESRQKFLAQQAILTWPIYK